LPCSKKESLDICTEQQDKNTEEEHHFLLSEEMLLAKIKSDIKSHRFCCNQQNAWQERERFCWTTEI